MRIPPIVSLVGLIAVAPAQAWRKIELSPHLKVSLPSTAVPVGPPKTEAGARVWTFMDRHATYLVESYTGKTKDELAMTPDAVLEATIEGICEPAGNPMIKKQRDILLNGWPGLEDVIVDDSGALSVRVLFVEKTTYTLAVVYPPSNGRPAGAETFLNSLTIVPPPPAGPQKSPGPTFQPFAPPGSDFEIGEPSKPEPEKITLESGAFLYRYSATYGNRTYVAAYTDALRDAPSGVLRDSVRDEILDALKAKPVKPPDQVTRGNLTFDNVEFTADKGLGGRVNVTEKGRRVYALMVVYPVGHAGSPDVDAYLDSFKLLAK